MTNSGLRYIDYDSGYSSRVSGSSKESSPNGYNQVVANINESNAKNLKQTILKPPIIVVQDLPTSLGKVGFIARKNWFQFVDWVQ